MAARRLSETKSDRASRPPPLQLIALSENEIDDGAMDTDQDAVDRIAQLVMDELLTEREEELRQATRRSSVMAPLSPVLRTSIATRTASVPAMMPRVSVGGSPALKDSGVSSFAEPPSSASPVTPPALLPGLQPASFRNLSTSSFVSNTKLRYVNRAAQVLQSIWYNRALVAMIVANVVILCLNDPLDLAKTAALNHTWDIVFHAVLTCHVVVQSVVLLAAHILIPNAKVQQLSKPETLLRGWIRHMASWHSLDSVLMLYAWIRIASDVPTVKVPNLSTILLLHVFRHMQKEQPDSLLQLLSDSLLAAMPHLANVMLLLGFVFLLFGLVGVQLFAGVLNQRCYFVQPAGSTNETRWDLNVTRVCSTSGIGYSCPTYPGIRTACGDYDQTPRLGLMSFDHAGYALFTIFQAVTMEGWTDIMYAVMDGAGDWSSLYFVVLISLGSLFLLNLILAVISDILSQERTAMDLRLKYERWSSLANESLLSVVNARADYQRSTAAAARVANLVATLVSQQLRQAQRPAARLSDTSISGTDLTPAQANAQSLLFRITRMIRQQNYGGALNPLEVLATQVRELHDGNSTVVPYIGETSQSSIPLSVMAPSTAASPSSDAVTAFDQHAAHDGFVPHTPQPPPAAVPPLSPSRQSTQQEAAGDPEAQPLVGAESTQPPASSWQVRFQPDPQAAVWRRLTYTLADSRWFLLATHAMVALATIFLAIEFYGMPMDLFWTLRYANLVLTALFFVELVIKVCGMTLEGYVSEKMNVLDGIVTLVSLGGLLYSGVGSASSPAVAALRAVRLFNLLSGFAAAKRLLDTVMRSLPLIAPFGFIVAILVLGFALIGMELLGNTGMKGRSNYDTLAWAAFTTFQVMTTENWIDVMTDSYQAAGWRGVTFVCCIIVIGAYVLLNLLIAVMISSCIEPQSRAAGIGASSKTLPSSVLQDADEQGSDTDASAGSAGDTSNAHGIARKKVATAFTLRVPSMSSQSAQSTAVSEEPAPFIPVAPLSPVVEAPAQSPQGADELMTPRGTHRFTTAAERANFMRATVQRVAASTFRTTKPVAVSPMSNLLHQAIERQRQTANRRRALAVASARHAQAVATRVKTQSKFDMHPSVTYKVFGFLPGFHPVRQLCGTVALHQSFEMGFLFLICLSCVTLAVDSPQANYDQWLVDALLYIDWITTLLFVSELVIKVIAFGLVGHPGAYLRDRWNAVDAVVVAASVLSLVLDTDISKSAKVLRLLRVIRPLRLVPRLEGLNMLVRALGAALPRCLHVLVLSVAVLFLFGILGVRLFGGMFYSCTDPARLCNPTVALDCPSELACVGTWLPDGAITPVPREWLNPRYGSSGMRYSFDHLGAAVLVLFEVASREMWPLVAYTMADVTRIGWAPQPNASTGNLWFIVVFVVFGALMMVNLFLVVVVDKFQGQRTALQDEDAGILTPSQRDWIRMQRLIASKQANQVLQLPETASRFRAIVFQVVTSTVFELLAVGAIIANAILVSLYHYGQSNDWDYWEDVAAKCMTAIFCMEVVAKLYALGIRQYFKSNWRSFDAIVVTIDVTSQIVLAVATTGSTSFIQLIRLLRLARAGLLMRLAKPSVRVRAVLFTLLVALPSFGNVGALLLLVYFIFAVAGMNLFSGLQYGAFITAHANFDSFGNSLLLLLRMSTGESWNGVMRDVAEQTSSAAALIYFVSFVVIGTFVMLNLSVAVILEAFQREMQAELLKDRVRSRDIDTFADVWNIVYKKCRATASAARLSQMGDDELRQYNDPSWLPAEAVHDLVMMLEPPLGVHKWSSFGRAKVLQVLRELEIPMSTAGYVHYHASLRAFVRRACGNDLPSDVDEAVHLSRRTIHRDPSLRMSVFNTSHLFAALFVQRWYRTSTTGQRFRNRAAWRRATHRVSRLLPLIRGTRSTAVHPLGVPGTAETTD